MTDQTSQFFAILTAVGEAKQANANALGLPWTFSQMGVGDANQTDPIPSRLQTRLMNERRRAPLNQVKVDPTNPSIIIAEQVIPPDVGGWWIREIGLYDAAGDLVAVANCAPSFKPLLSQGTGKTQVVRLNIIVTSSGNVQLKIDPAVVLATRDYVDSLILSVLPPDKTAGTYSQVRVDARGVVQQGFNPTTLAGHGITDGFARSIDSTDYDLLTQSGLYHLGSGSTAHRPLGFSGAVALHHEYGVHAFTMASDLGTDSVAFRRREPGGFGQWRFLWHSANFNPGFKADKASTLGGYGITDGATKTELASKADKAASLAGYGVSFASQTEAEAGVDTNKPMSALRVFQAITAKVVQATGSSMGLARLASLVDVFAGTDDTTIITPKKAAALFPFRGMKLFNVTGVYTWTVPVGVTKAWVEVVGGGGGGARSALVPGPSGGGGGGVAMKLVDLNGVTSVTVTVGQGGPGAVAMEAIGVNGGTSAFGGYCSATGGQGGVINGNGSNAGGGIGGDQNFTIGFGAVPVGSSGNTSFLGGCGGGGESTYARADASPPSKAGHGGGGRTDSAGAPGAAGQVLIRW